MSTHKMEKLFIEGQKEDSDEIGDYVHRGMLSDLSHGAGPSVMKRKFDQFLLRMGY